ncbi:Lar family restriction alleviation protein [Acinetobacter sp. SEK570]|uniref:Lar family restriction alleviation protein n=1 Tax=unclassified Acinetobacter TaxID=196816 RepID=UPI0039A02AD0
MKTVIVDWLGSCPHCGCNQAIVGTELGSEKFLYEDDVVKCKQCSLSGIVEVTDDYADDQVAYAKWSEFKETKADAEGK